MGRSKRCRVQKQHNRDNDRVSNLPDDVLHCILSFLPTKYAVSTSVLSTRWRYLWTSIHNLEFSHLIPYSSIKNKLKKKLCQSFYDCVDKVFYDVVSSINKFSLECVECDETHLNQWISKLVSRKVQEIDLIVQKDYVPMRLTKCLFTCDTLRILKLDMDVHVEIPCLIRFSNLKILHFIHISFSAKDSATTEISLSCPVLEDLFIHYCEWLKISGVDVSSPALQMLSIRHNRRSQCIVKIGAERLRSMKLDNICYFKYFLCDLSSLVEADIGGIYEVDVHSPCNFPHCLFTCELKILKIAMKLSININSFTNFSTLKVIDLKLIAFCSEQPNQQLYWTCPVLEELVLYFCTWTKIKTINIAAPKLRMLKIEDREHTCPSDNDIGCEFKFNAPSIVSLLLIISDSCKYSLSHLSSLADVSIHVSSFKAGQYDPLLRLIYNLKELKLSLYSIKVLLLPDVSTSLHIFSRLTHLTLLDYPHIKHEAISGRRFTDLLANMPNLEHLFIPNLSWIQCKGNDCIIGTTNQDFLSRLKFVKINYTSWILEELWFVEFLIKIFSHELTISLWRPGGHRRQKMNSEKLEEIAKGSKCIIQYHFS